MEYIKDFPTEEEIRLEAEIRLLEQLHLDIELRKNLGMKSLDCEDILEYIATRVKMLGANRIYLKNK